MQNKYYSYFPVSMGSSPKALQLLFWLTISSPSFFFSFFLVCSLRPKPFEGLIFNKPSSRSLANGSMTSPQGLAIWNEMVADYANYSLQTLPATVTDGVHMVGPIQCPAGSWITSLWRLLGQKVASLRWLHLVETVNGWSTIILPFFQCWNPCYVCGPGTLE